MIWRAEKLSKISTKQGGISMISGPSAKIGLKMGNDINSGIISMISTVLYFSNKS